MNILYVFIFVTEVHYRVLLLSTFLQSYNTHVIFVKKQYGTFIMLNRQKANITC